jgi:DNA-binding GntR family transcriptional regulator
MAQPSSPARIPATRAEAVADDLRRRIISGEFAPGRPLRQQEIAAEFGGTTSRS